MPKKRFQPEEIIGKQQEIRLHRGCVLPYRLFNTADPSLCTGNGGARRPSFSLPPQDGVSTRFHHFDKSNRLN